MPKEKSLEKRDMFTVYQGTQPKFTGNENDCQSVAGKLRADAIAQGTDISNKEHAVSVIAV